MQNTAVKINAINIVKELFKFENKMNEKEIYDENMLMKIQVVRQEVDLFRRKTF